MYDGGGAEDRRCAPACCADADSRWQHAERLPAAVQGAYLTLGQFTTPQHWRNAAILVTMVALGGTGLWAYSTVTETQKRQKYQRAYEEVQKMK